MLLINGGCMDKFYGLIMNGELAYIQRFNHIPNFFDFHVSYASWNKYDIVEVEPIIKNICERKDLNKS